MNCSQTWHITSSKELRLMRSRKEFGTKMKGVAGSWTHLHVAVILDKNYYSNIIQVVSLNSLSYVGDLGSMGYKKMHTGLWWV